MLLPEDTAYRALYLASDESKMATGTQIIVDGADWGYDVQLARIEMDVGA